MSSNFARALLNRLWTIAGVVQVAGAPPALRRTIVDLFDPQHVHTHFHAMPCYFVACSGLGPSNWLQHPEKRLQNEFTEAWSPHLEANEEGGGGASMALVFLIFLALLAAGASEIFLNKL